MFEFDATVWEQYGQFRTQLRQRACTVWDRGSLCETTGEGIKDLNLEKRFNRAMMTALKRVEGRKGEKLVFSVWSKKDQRMDVLGQQMTVNKKKTIAAVWHVLKVQYCVLCLLISFFLMGTNGAWVTFMAGCCRMDQMRNWTLIFSSLLAHTTSGSVISWYTQEIDI